MIIYVDKEGMGVIGRMIDSHLKSGGFSSLKETLAVVNNIKEIPPREQPKPPKDEKPIESVGT